jgi:nitroreductase
MRKPAETDHPVSELVRERWSPRAFADGSVAQEDLDSLLEAARWAPSSRNSQPWRFVVARREDEPAFASILGCLVEWNRGWAEGAAALLVACAEVRDGKGRHLTHAWYDTGQAVAWLTVEATARGLAVHQMGGFSAEAVRLAFALPEGLEAVTVIAIGYPGDPASLPEEYRAAEREPRSRRPQGETRIGAPGKRG